MHERSQIFALEEEHQKFHSVSDYFELSDPSITLSVHTYILVQTNP